MRRHKDERRILGIINGTIHQNGPHFSKFETLEGFCEDISPHLLRGTKTKVDFLRIIIVFDEDLFRFDVFCTFGAGETPILFEGEGTHIILKDDILRNGVTLSFEEMTCPENIP